MADKPFMYVGKKKHPFGKPIDAHFFDLRIWVGFGYIGGIGVYKGKLVHTPSKANDVTLFFQDKENSGAFRFDKDSGRKLYEALKKFYDEDKKGYVKKTYSGVTLTKHRRYR